MQPLVSQIFLWRVLHTCVSDTFHINQEVLDFRVTVWSEPGQRMGKAWLVLASVKEIPPHKESRVMSPDKAQVGFLPTTCLLLFLIPCHPVASRAKTALVPAWIPGWGFRSFCSRITRRGSPGSMTWSWPNSRLTVFIQLIPDWVLDSLIAQLL